MEDADDLATAMLDVLKLAKADPGLSGAALTIAVARYLRRVRVTHDHKTATEALAMHRAQVVQLFNAPGPDGNA